MAVEHEDRGDRRRDGAAQSRDQRSLRAGVNTARHAMEQVVAVDQQDLDSFQGGAVHESTLTPNTIATVLLLVDLDGVVYRGRDPVPGMADVLQRRAAAGDRIIYVTNNSRSHRDEYVARLKRMGVPLGRGGRGEHRHRRARDGRAARRIRPATAFGDGPRRAGARARAARRGHPRRAAHRARARTRRPTPWSSASTSR